MISKLILAFSFLCIVNVSFSQLSGFKIDTINRYSLTKTGTIGDEIPITLHARVEEFYEGNIFSLSGWYYYDKVKKPIPLVGIHSDFSGTVFYNFKDQKSADSVLHFISSNPDLGMWELIEDLQNKTSYNERFFFNYEGEQTVGTWQNAKKELKVDLYYQLPDFYEYNEFLSFQVNKVNKMIDLYEHFNHGDFKFESKVQNGKNTRVLLSYACPSRGIYSSIGMCSGGTDTGYAIIELDPKGNIVFQATYEIEICLANQYTEEKPTTQNGITTYKIFKENYQTEQSEEWLMKVDVAKVEVTLTKIEK